MSCCQHAEDTLATASKLISPVAIPLISNSDPYITSGAVISSAVASIALGALFALTLTEAYITPADLLRSAVVISVFALVLSSSPHLSPYLALLYLTEGHSFAFPCSCLSPAHGFPSLLGQRSAPALLSSVGRVVARVVTEVALCFGRAPAGLSGLDIGRGLKGLLLAWEWLWA